MLPLGCQILALRATRLVLDATGLSSEDSVLDLENSDLGGWVKIFVSSGRLKGPVDRQWKAEVRKKTTEGQNKTIFSQLMDNIFFTGNRDKTVACTRNIDHAIKKI